MGETIIQQDTRRTGAGLFLGSGTVGDDPIGFL
jgi:hypothetical protein